VLSSPSRSTGRSANLVCILAGLDRCFFFAVNKNTDEIYGERIRLDKAEAKLADQQG
jgi:hypothetical protein